MAVVAELLGTCSFTMLGMMRPSPLVNGMTLAVIVASTAPISGGHLNPAVTLAAVVAGDIRLVVALAYILAQCAGAVAGCFVAMSFIESECTLPAFSFASVVVEAIGTLPLMLAVFSPAVHPIIRPVVIGMGFTVGSLVAYSGGSGNLNPARVMFPGIVSCSSWSSILGQTIAPIITGAGVGILACANKSAAPQHFDESGESDTDL
jgi:glycerol uptake facilitator-like aquaporin